MNSTVGKDKILIVDDHPESIWPLVENLEADFDILFATTGERALSIALSENRPSLILLDVMMPGMDGYEVCSRLKSHDSTSEIPVIFLSGNTQDMEEAKGMEMGAQDYISMPYSAPVVRARIQSVLDLKREMGRRLLLKMQLEQLNSQIERQVRQKMAALEEAQETLRAYEERYRHLFERKLTERARKCILVVDDNPENIHILIEHLESEYEVLFAVNGEKALRIAASSENRPDLVLLDIMMPGMDGYEVCARLKANAETWDIPVIFVTALGQDMNETKGFNLGAVDFITKPFSMPVVRARINAALRLKEEMDNRMALAKKLEDLNRDLERRVKEKTAELELALENLLASERKYRVIFDTAIEGIFQTTPAGRLLGANHALAQILGYASTEELETTVTDVGHQAYLPSRRPGRVQTPSG